MDICRPHERRFASAGLAFDLEKAMVRRDLAWISPRLVFLSFK
jgi:hypothetical protein